MKKIVSILLMLCMLSTTVFGVSFSDVNFDTEEGRAIAALAEKGIINGYEGGVFKPNNNITRAETAAIIARAVGLPHSDADSIYSDVYSDYWACPYIMAVSNAGIINGMGDGTFAPYYNVTYYQIIKLVVCMAGLENEAKSAGGWPKGYVEVAYQHGIINAYVYGNCMNGTWFGNLSATRADVALFVYNALPQEQVSSDKIITVGGVDYGIGMSASELGVPNEILPSTKAFDWYVYGSNDYKNFIAAGVAGGKVVALATAGVGFDYNGYRMGDTISEDSPYKKYIYTDSNDADIIHGVLIVEDAYNSYTSQTVINPKTLYSESKMNFHLTNAFRVYHRMYTLRWDETAANTARLHSEDMADNDYFSHTGLNGSRPGDRLQEQGVRWSSYAENIAAGTIRKLGFHTYDGWINSSGHRQNMLTGTCTNLGVGIAHNASSTYTYYHTQVYYK